MSAYKKALTPLRLACGLELKNRIVMGSMHTGLEEKIGRSGGLDEMAAFYRERASAGLMVTGGVAPNREGWVAPFSGKLTDSEEASHHKVVTAAVKDAGGKMALQILHAGRYAYHPWAVGASSAKAPISPFSPRGLSVSDISRTVSDFARTTELAREAGYDGVEIMGSEGYLINQFLAPRTNTRDDAYGGTFEKRARLPVEIVKACRAAAGDDFAILFRLSLLELVDNGMTFEEAAELAHMLDVDVLTSGIGWHEARVPTIATCVPRAGFSFAAARLKKETGMVVCATNRINDMKVADEVLESVDLVSMARPFLADPEIVAKAYQGKEDETNTCIACNQACLDHTFKMLPVSCLVNPRAGHETSLNLVPTKNPRRVAVVGAGMAGMSCATSLAERGHHVTLFEAADKIGGQFNLAARVPGKEEFYETLRYFKSKLRHVDVRLGTKIDAAEALVDYDAVVVATGVEPRRVVLPELDDSGRSPRIRDYQHVLREGAEPCGERVAIIGAGGIGFDVAEFLSGHADFYDEWGVDVENLSLKQARMPPMQRTITLLQRKTTTHGAGLGKTTGWIHRASLKKRHVNMLKGCEYEGVSSKGLHVRIAKQPPLVIPCDDIILCAGQLSVNGLFDDLNAAGVPAFLIGGAEKAAELDAKRAVDQGVRLAANFDDAKPGSVFNMPTGWKAKAVDFMQSNLRKRR